MVLFFIPLCNPDSLVYLVVDINDNALNLPGKFFIIKKSFNFIIQRQFFFFNYFKDSFSFFDRGWGVSFKYFNCKLQIFYFVILL